MREHGPVHSASCVIPGRAVIPAKAGIQARRPGHRLSPVRRAEGIPSDPVIPAKASPVIPAEASPVIPAKASPVIPAKAGIQRRLVAHLTLFLALALVLLPLGAHAFRVSYEGVLVSEQSGDPPVPVTLRLDVSLGVAKGNVETRSPLIGKGEIEGIEKYGTCEIHGNIGPATVLRLKGACNMTDTVFEGVYKIRVRDRPYQQGTFRMTRVGSADARPGQSAVDEPAFSPGGSMTRCIDSNRMCLAGCRTSNYNETLMCTNRCRRAMAKCKAAVSGAHSY